MTESMRFLMIVDDPAIARYCAAHGVGRLFVDLERLGKADRQKHLQSWKSHQTPADVTRIREAAPEAHLLVRLNPLHEGSSDEVEDAVQRGADSLMLPMFRTLDEVAGFVDLVAGRAEVVPLCETLASLEVIPAMIEQLPISDLHIGMNDLHLDRGDHFIFQPLADDILDEPCAALRASNKRFGIGGLARAGEGIVTPELLIGEHVRLGSDSAILSRTFHRNARSLEDLLEGTDFDQEVARLQEIFSGHRAASPAALERNHAELVARINGAVLDMEGGRAR